MSFFVGIDGGGTGTRVYVADADGRVLGRATAGLSNLHHAADDQVRQHLASAFDKAFASAAIQPAQCKAVFAGMAGVTTASTAVRFEALIRACGFGEASIGVDHDIRIALAGGLAGKPGIALIVGTGSSCYGRDAAGNTCQTGGWGALVADEGSGYDLALHAIIAAVRMADGRMDDAPLRDAVFSWLGISDVSEILRRLYEDGITRTEIAAFAPDVVRIAETGDAAAVAVLKRGAEELAQMVEANHRRLPTGPTPYVAITGGLGTANTLYRVMLEYAIRERVPGVHIAELYMSPTAGAVMLAMQQAGGAITPAILSNLQETSQ